MTDVLIIGAGAAGLSLALQLADRYCVTLLSKKDLCHSATYLAQGGVAAVQESSDSFESHISDTLVAGAGLCDSRVVEMVISSAPKAVERLRDLGVVFTTDSAKGDASLDLNREAGHSHSRILHVNDQTGKAISNTLIDRVRAHPNITLRTHCLAVDLIRATPMGALHDRCLGAYVYDVRAGHVESIAARVSVLASGGASKAYLFSTNSEGVSGDGVAMAWRAGCAVANLEFNQFHPTCLYHAHSASFLISEAMRGAGAKLVLADGKPFMADFDERADLAPRDIVARAIDFQMKRFGLDCVYLDVSQIGAKEIPGKFPGIHQHCLSLGIDICSNPIPVVPAAHYTCGGVMTDMEGATSLTGLYCIGECANTGLHGANRLASNSLLECLVFADRCADQIATVISHVEPVAVPEWDTSHVSTASEDVLVSHNWDELRRCMWNYVGIVRSNERLYRAAQRIHFLADEVNGYYKKYPIHTNLIELRNLLLVSDLIVRSALKRKESRGLHYTVDYPDSLEQVKSTILQPPL